VLTFVNTGLRLGLMARPRHPSKEIEAAVRYAEERGWAVQISSGHAWGKMLCPLHTREGCVVWVYSTPRSTGNHAKALLRKVDACRHAHEEER
jgi:hypothetical protein